MAQPAEKAFMALLKDLLRRKCDQRPQHTHPHQAGRRGIAKNGAVWSSLEEEDRVMAAIEPSGIVHKGRRLRKGLATSQSQ